MHTDKRRRTSAAGEVWAAARIDPLRIGGAESLLALERFRASAAFDSIEEELVELVRARTLQLVGGPLGEQHCRTVVVTHPNRRHKITCLPDWYTSREFSAVERAALMWTEDIVYADANGVSDLAYADAVKTIPPRDLWALAVTVAATCASVQIAQAFRLTVRLTPP